jgi:hypothetical protein
MTTISTDWPCYTIGCSNRVPNKDEYCGACLARRREEARANIVVVGVRAGEAISFELPEGGFVRRVIDEDGLHITRGEHIIFLPAAIATAGLRDIGWCLPGVPVPAHVEQPPNLRCA